MECFTALMMIIFFLYNLRIVHGKNRQHLSLILKPLKLKQKGEEKQLLGQILMEEMNCSLALDQMERCQLVDHKMLTKCVVCGRGKANGPNNERKKVG